MSLRTVIYDDLRNISRSYVVVGVIGVFICLVALIFISEIDIYDNPYRVLWDVWALIAFVGPLFLAPLSYLAIAGDRESGTIKYVLGLPNSRVEYYVGKLISRTLVAVTAILLSVIWGYIIAALTFVNPPDLIRFLVFLAVSLVYVVSTVSVFIAISASTKKRSRAMFGTLGIYFLFVPFWFGFFPVINIETIVDTIAQLFGVTVSDETSRRIGTLSPAVAYLEATEPVYNGVLDQYEVFNQFESNEKLVGKTWFNILVMVLWSAITLPLGYLKFKSSEIG